MGSEHHGEERMEVDLEKAERTVHKELKKLGWFESNLAKRAKGDLSKVALSGRLGAETMVAAKWNGERLAMGTAGYVNNRLYRWRNGKLK